MMALGAADPAVIAALPGLIEKTDDPRELLLVLTTAALAAPDAAISSSLWKRVSSGTPLDPTQQDAARLAMRRQGITLLGADFANFSADPPASWSDREILAVITRIAAGPDRPALVALATTAPAGLRPHIEKILTAAPVFDRTPVEVPGRFMPGRDLYMKACIECHQADGRGVALTFPPLAGSEWVKGDRDTLLRIILGGLSGPIEVNNVKFDSVMPGHSHVSDTEIASIASFVRFAFGDIKEKPVTPEDVKTLRPEVEKRKFVPWTAEDLRAAGK